MTEQRFILRNDSILSGALDAIVTAHKSGVLHEAIVRPVEKGRTLPQNSRYWASLTEYLREVAATIIRVSDRTGYTPLEVKRLIAKDMPPEHVAILFAKSPEVAHDVLKEICNVPTSTRLGTKKFMEFEETMERTIAEISGHIQDFERMAA